jgi:hypothetical protein
MGAIMGESKILAGLLSSGGDAELYVELYGELYVELYGELYAELYPGLFGKAELSVAYDGAPVIPLNCPPGTAG